MFVPGPCSSDASPQVLPSRGAGISASCPSATRPRLALGPGSPRGDQLHPGNLRYSAWGIRTPISLLIPAFSLHMSPRVLAGRASSSYLCSPTDDMKCHPAASVSCLSPGHFRRRASRPVSCYALFEWVAASEPTSWLSTRPHILCHLTRPLGPWPAVWAVSLSTVQLISYSLTPGRSARHSEFDILRQALTPPREFSALPPRVA